MKQRIVKAPEDLLAVVRILHACGKDMATKYDLHHWDNSYLKSALIVLMSFFHNKIWVVEDQGTILATYQTKVVDQALFFEKLAVRPEINNHGIGSYCLKKIEEEAQNINRSRVIMDVYAESKHAIQFYLKHGYTQTGEDKTLKYHIIRMEKELYS